MLRFTRGNLFDAPVEALVNAVNEVGVMGKGLALQFRDAFPVSARAYMAACARRDVRVGSVLVTDSGVVSPRWVIHFPTKRHWRNPSQIEWVRDGLVDLVRVLAANSIRSVALPALGCGLGGLPWAAVRLCISQAMEAVPDIDATVYEPEGAGERSASGPQGVRDLWP